MMTMETIGRIRRAHLVEGESIRGIARRLRVSRQVVRRAIASETGEFHYERSVQPLPKLGSHVADLNRLLEENERRPRRERLTLMRIWEELRGLGLCGRLRCGSSLCAGAGSVRAMPSLPKPMSRSSYARRAKPTSSTGATRSSCSRA